MTTEFNPTELFHHIHHMKGEHQVHHCGGAHVKTNPKLNYKIRHCKCGKHKIDQEKALGHDLNHREVLVKFSEKCPEGGWHIESGKLSS